MMSSTGRARALVSRTTPFKPSFVKRCAGIRANPSSRGQSSNSTLHACAAVVARGVPDFALVVGVQARRIGWESHTGERLTVDLKLISILGSTDGHLDEL